MFDLFDLHSHLNLPEFNSEREEQIKKLEKLNIGTITVGVDKASSSLAVELAQKSKNLFASIGIHPTDSSEDFDENFFEGLVKDQKVVAIGECGLDYFRIPADDIKTKNRQKELFKKQIEFAIRHEKSLMLHCRPSKGTMDAYEEALDILESYKNNLNLCGNAHFFVGDIKVANRFFNLGFSVSFPGIITFVRDFDEIIKSAPRELIMSETDAPFAAPVPYRGQRNESSYVLEVVKKIAEIRGENLEKTQKMLAENAIKYIRPRS
jgi:TatD DNase family protein